MEPVGGLYFVRKLAATHLKRQKVRPGDYIGQDGLLYCGTCGCPRQAKRSFLDPVPGNPEARTELLVPVMCRCDKEQEQREEAEKKAAEDMEQMRMLRRASLMDSRFDSARFENFAVTPENERILHLCQRYADGFDEMMENSQGLLFWGSVGSGKSFAAACIANRLLERRVPVMMTSFVKLVSWFQTNGTEEQDVIMRLNRAKLVIFDDLGAERSTDYALEKVYDLIDTRYRRKLPMILTTNLTMNEMKSTMDTRYMRIYDRIFECCYAVHFRGQSMRRAEAARRYEEMHRLLEG